MRIFKSEIFWTLLTVLPIIAFLIASIVVSEKVRKEEEAQVVSPISLILTDSATVYFESTHEKEFKIPVVKFNVNGVMACFIVDTGSNGSILDYKWYKENSELFTFKKDTYIDYVGVSGVSTIRTVYVDGLVNGINVSFTTSDLSAIIKTLKNHKLNVVGILGSVYLEKNNYIINYNTKSIYKTIN